MLLPNICFQSERVKKQKIYRFAHKSMSKIAIRDQMPGTRWDGTGQLTEISGMIFFRKISFKDCS
jgi:hypothetical protein